MCRLNHPNVVRVLGVCSKEDPLCVIVEYMKYGDLNQYLKQHLPESTVARRNKAVKMLRWVMITISHRQVGKVNTAVCSSSLDYSIYRLVCVAATGV